MADYNIICASYDTPEKLKQKADYICEEQDARPTLQKAIDEADSLNVSCVLLKGTYCINSHSERSEKGGICFYNPEKKGEFYSQNRSRFQVLEGNKPPFGFFDGAIITMGKQLYDSLSDTEPFSLFYSDGNDIYGRGMIIRNLVVSLPGSYKPVVVFDGRFAAGIKYENNWVTSFDPSGKNLATAEGIPVPHSDSVAFRCCMGSNAGPSGMKNCVAQGFGTGFEIGGEHIYCEGLGAVYNIYGFTFDCYKGKSSIDLPDDTPAKGITIYPITCVNLCDEHNFHMPRFGNASHNGYTKPQDEQTITIIGMNLQWPNSCPGRTDRTAPDFTEGRHRATEAQPGSWHGSIEYVIDHTTPTSNCNLTDEPFFEVGHGTQITARNLHTKK